VGLDEATAREQLQVNALPEAATAAGGGASGYRFGNRYWVFVDEGGKPVARPVVTGVTDMDYSEVLAGLNAGDAVYLLPSSGLVESQQRFQQQMRQFTGMPGMTQSQGSRSGDAAEGGRPASGRPAGSRPESARPEGGSPGGTRPEGGQSQETGRK
jgi:hypothetical protein